MAPKEILAEIDAEIARLQQARVLLVDIGGSTRRRGMPKQQTTEPVLSKPAKKKRNLTPEGRARIAEAVKRRWTKQKATTKK